MVQLSLPLLDNTDNESGNSSTPNCDPSQSIYDSRYCIKDFLFCSDDNPCPSNIPCIDRVCQCLPNTHSYITLTPPPVRMYTIGCNFDTKRPFDTCRNYEYGVNNQSCLLNYCSSEVSCYAGTCDTTRNVCVDTTTHMKTLPQSTNALISLGDDPFGTNKTGTSPVVIILLAAGGIVALALIGCIVRTTSSCTKRSVAWVTGKKDPEANAEEEEGDYATDGKDGHRLESDGPKMEDIDSISGGSANAFARKPSKFTGHHYMPSPHLHPTNDSVSAFNSPLPSPHISPYSQPNHSQVSNNSLLNPFRQGAGDDNSNVTIELNDRSITPSRSYESLSPAAAAAMGGSAGAGMSSYGVDPRMSRSQSTLSRNQNIPYSPAPIPVPAPGSERPGSSLHKSMSMQQLGSRPAPPPPGHGTLSGPIRMPSPPPNQGNLSGPIRMPSPPPAMAVTSPLHSRPPTIVMSQADIEGPYLSLDSLIEQASQDSRGGSLEPKSEPLPIPLSGSASARSSLVIQSGAERHPSLTVVAPKQSMLRHSASVPQLFVSPSSPSEQSPPPISRPSSPPTSRPSSPLSRPSSPPLRNLPAGFVSSPLANTQITPQKE
ncbi:hypothetical protein BGX20_008595 [Mortierella sp. AD010]|nr:hypothetical protein BGX20_008595 [Mortierella sp. AD010]